MPTKTTLETIRVLKTLWGNDATIPSYKGSPHEETYLDEAELILHELAHQVLIPFICLTPRWVGDTWYAAVGARIETCSHRMADFHEMRAVAIELVAAQKLGLRLVHYVIIENSANNTRFFASASGNKVGDAWRLFTYRKIIARLKRAPYIRRKADTIVALVERVRKEGL
jgi:hypothetical protein